MKVQRLQIEQQMAKIKVESQMASLKIDTAQRRMRVEKQDVQMSVKRVPSSIDLDMQEFFDEIGLRSTESFRRKVTSEAQQKAQNGIQQIVRDGKFLGTLPATGNRVGELAKMKMLQSPVKEISGSVPHGTIDMKGKPGKIDINWSNHDVKIVWDEFQSPTIQVVPKAAVNVRVVQQPRIEFEVVEMEIPPSLGSSLDAEA